MTTVSSTYLISTLFPKIIQLMKPILANFGHAFDQTIEKKGKQKNYSTQAVKKLLTNFPHHYQTYSACVNEYVEIARSSPEPAIAVLLKTLPERPENSYYGYLASQLLSSSSLLSPNIINLFITLYVVDCLAQILTLDPGTSFKDELLTIGYEVIAPFSEEYEQPFRETIVRQYSVIFSILSAKYLSKIISDVPTVQKNSDQSLFFILYRFIRVSFSDRASYDQLRAFYDEFSKMCPHKTPTMTKTNQKRVSYASSLWAIAMSNLLSQIKITGLKDYTEIFENTYKASLDKAMGKSPHLNNVILCANIMLMLNSIEGKTLDDFLKDVIFRTKDPRFLEQSLTGFLIIIRGSYVAEFWEWGSFNFIGCPGIEATYLNKPDEDQSLPNSFTNLFLSHFTSLPIEQYPKVVSAILLNFAARDFSYFFQSTIPNLISSLGDDRTIICIKDCLQQIIEPNFHFAQWAQDNVRNNGIRIDQSYSLLFNSLKTTIFQNLLSYTQSNGTVDAFLFSLTDSKDTPHFQIPFKTEAYTKVIKERLLKAEQMVDNILDDWKFTKSKDTTWLDIKVTTVQQVTDEEMKIINVLKFVPLMINTSDLNGYDLAMFLINKIVSDSLPVSSFVIRIINQIFAKEEDSRIIFYETVLLKMSKITNTNQLFILLQLLVKLLDLSLSVNAPVERIQAFVTNCQPVILYLFTFPYPDFRDLTLRFIERLRNFCTIFNVHLQIGDIFYKYNPIISSVVRAKVADSLGREIPNSYITLQEACLTREVNIYRYFLVEMTTVYLHLVEPELLAKTLTMFLTQLGPQPNDRSSPYSYQYLNVVTVLTHLIPAFPKPDPINQSIKDMKSKYYGFPILLSSVSDNDKACIETCKLRIVELLQKSLEMVDIEKSSESNSLNIELIRFINASMINGFLPMLTSWLDEPKAKQNLLIPIASEIWKNVIQTTDLNLTLLLFDHRQSDIVGFILLLQEYLNEMKLNDVNSPLGIDRDNMKIIINYCIIIKTFTKAVNGLHSKTKNTGAILSYENSFSNSSNWTADKCRDTLQILFNYAKQKGNKAMELLQKQAVEALGSFLRYAIVFDSDHPLQSDLRSFIINELEMNDHHVLPFMLANHRDLFYDHFVNSMFTEKPGNSVYYFLAVSSLYYINYDEYENFSQFSSYLPSQNVTSLSQNDVWLNKQLVQYSPKLIIASLLYMLNIDFGTQKTAFYLLKRIIPVILTIINQDNVQLIQDVMKDFNEMAPSFNSEIITVSQEDVQGIASVFVTKMPFLTDVLLTEAFELIRKSANGAFVSTSTTGLLLYLLMPLINLEISFSKSISNKKNLFGLSLITLTPITFIDNLISISPFVESRDVVSYLSIWDQLASDDSLFDFALNRFLDMHTKPEEASKVNLSDNPNVQKYIKTIVVQFAKKNSRKVIEALTDRLSFAYWYSATMQGNTKSKVIPNSPRESQFNSIIVILCELIKPYFDQILPKLHLIFNFILIRYDPNNLYQSDLMIRILNQFGDCPDELIHIYHAPTSLFWPGEMNAEQESKEFTPIDINLRPFNKESITVQIFAKKLVDYLMNKTMPNENMFSSNEFQSNSFASYSEALNDNDIDQQEQIIVLPKDFDIELPKEEIRTEQEKELNADKKVDDKKSDVEQETRSEIEHKSEDENIKFDNEEHKPNSNSGKEPIPSQNESEKEEMRSENDTNNDEQQQSKSESEKDEKKSEIEPDNEDTNSENESDKHVKKAENDSDNEDKKFEEEEKKSDNEPDNENKKSENKSDKQDKKTENDVDINEHHIDNESHKEEKKLVNEAVNENQLESIPLLEKNDGNERLEKESHFDQEIPFPVPHHESESILHSSPISTHPNTDVKTHRKKRRSRFKSGDFLSYKTIVTNWGNELIRWICGCGDLLLSSRSSCLFAQILQPVTTDVIKSILRSFSIVTATFNDLDNHSNNITSVDVNRQSSNPKAPKDTTQATRKAFTSPETAETDRQPGFSFALRNIANLAFPHKTLRDRRSKSFYDRLGRAIGQFKVNDFNLSTYYIVSTLNLLSKLIDVFKDETDYQLIFMPIYQICLNFLKLRNYNTISKEALRIIVKFINHSNEDADKLQLNTLLKRLCGFCSSRNVHDEVYAAFLAIFKHQNANQQSALGRVSLICFIPFIYNAISAYHNVQPFSSEMKNSEIAKVLECIPLISSCQFVSNELKSVFSSLFQSPDSYEPDKFIVQSCAHISSGNNEVILNAGDYLYKMAKNAGISSSLRCGIFEIIDSFFKLFDKDINDKLAEKYSPIILLISDHSYLSSQAKELMRSYLLTIPQTTETAKKLPFRQNSGQSSPQSSTTKIDDISAPKWTKVNQSIDQLINLVAPINQAKIPVGKSSLFDPLLIVPLSFWNSQVSLNIRDLLSNVTVSHYSFTDIEKYLRKCQKYEIGNSCEALRNFKPPVDANMYLSYLHHL